MSDTLEKQQPLRQLTEEHDHVLELCFRIREGLNRKVETHRIRSYVDWFKKNYLNPHFEVEEKIIFPLLERNARVKRALANHRRINRLLSCSCEDLKVLNLLEEELSTFIRFEERILYNEIKAVASPDKLLEIKKHHEGVHFDAGAWNDRFWIS